MFDDVECNVLCIVDAMVHVLEPWINAQSPRVWCIMCSLHLPVLVPGLKLSQNSPNVFSWLRGVKGYLNAKNCYNFYFLGSMPFFFNRYVLVHKK